MPGKQRKVPGYCRHKATGKAVVRLNRRDHYLGPFGSPESHAEYARLIAEWQVQQQETPLPSDPPITESPRRTVSDLLLQFREFARGYYVKDGRPTKQFTNLKYALRPLRLLYGNTPADAFGPLALKAVRQTMVESGLCRGEVNKRVKTIKRFWKWAVSEELVPPRVFEAVRTVEALKFGRTEARESEPIKPVPEIWIEAVLPHVSRYVAAMIRLQQLTGMRPGEVVLMRGCDIDHSEATWIYEPFDHKNRWRGQSRRIPLGPKAQLLLAPFLNAGPDEYLFSPRKAEDERHHQRRAARRSPMTPSQSRRQAKARPKRPKRERYDVDSYRRAIDYAVKKLNKTRAENDQIPQWCPLQIRHLRATEVRKMFGLEGAQVSLGHTHANVTEVYAERNLELAIRIAQQTG